MEFKRLIENIIYLIYPKRCPVCGDVISPDREFCIKCRIEKCRIEEERCPLCSQGEGKCVCAYEKDRRYDRLASVFYYRDEAGECVKNFKFNSCFEGGKYLASQMEKLLEETYGKNGFDFAVGVPITKKRKRTRGFSQTDYLLKIISKSAGVPYEPKLLIKIKETVPQVQLKAKDRKTNLQGAFGITDPEKVKGKTVLLCDDVKTTGATLNECAKTLKKAGARRVLCITAATAENFIKEEEM